MLKILGIGIWLVF